jgi:hypothetical protein
MYLLHLVSSALTCNFLDTNLQGSTVSSNVKLRDLPDAPVNVQHVPFSVVPSINNFYYVVFLSLYLPFLARQTLALLPFFPDLCFASFT